MNLFVEHISSFTSHKNQFGTSDEQYKYVISVGELVHPASPWRVRDWLKYVESVSETYEKLKIGKLGVGWVMTARLACSRHR